MKDTFYVTTFCNHAHRLADGKPIGHECYVLPTAALHAERAGKIGVAVEELGKWKKRKKHRGVKDAAEEYEEAVVDYHQERKKAVAKSLAASIIDGLNSPSETRRLFRVERVPEGDADAG